MFIDRICLEVEMLKAELEPCKSNVCAGVLERSQIINIPDGVTSPQTNPLWDGSVLLLGSGKLLLGTE
jgi:hypothetical protein